MALTLNWLTVFVALDKDRDEGILMAADSNTRQYKPLVAADEGAEADCYAIAASMRKNFGIDFRVFRFSVREDITEETKQKYGKP
ncbi:MAG TPA: hypothetical protein VFV08_12250 [Puia sp.]|nr:hypothetical protein [Puia sp.]